MPKTEELSVFLEIRRVFSTVGSRGWGRVVFEFLVLPLLVAGVMTTAFLARSTPDAQGEAFLFFGTLYAFWCGLFGSCQAFNGEVSSGEWSYWMLGMRRSVVRHHVAHFVAAFSFAAIQVAASLFFLWLLWQLGVWIKPLGYHFVFHGEGNSFVNQVGAMLRGGTAFHLQGLQESMNEIDHAIVQPGKYAPNGLWFRFCLSYYLAGVAAAVVSGVAVGLLVSAICPTPQVSLTVSVFLIVACTVFSHTGILGFGSDSAAVREFSPLNLIIRQRGRQFGSTDVNEHRQTRWKDGGFVEQASFLLPQRYFFNIARVPCLKLDASLGRGLDPDVRSWDDATRLLDHAASPADYCKCPVCLGIAHVTNRVDDIVVIDGDGKNIRYEKHWISAGDTSGKWRTKVFGEQSVKKGPAGYRKAVRDNAGGVRNLLSLCRSMAWGEIAALFVWCFICLVATLLLLKKKGSFNELR